MISHSSNKIDMKDCKNIDYEEFYNSSNEIINAAPKFIIFPHRIG